MTQPPDAPLTVLYPMYDLRGRAADRVRTWTHGQTLARDRYRVVVGSDATAAAQESEVAALLGPRDELFRLPGARDAALWNAGATRAGTPWLVFCEGHCLADGGCLAAVARWVGSAPEAGAGNFDVGHDTSYLHGRLSQRWFDMIHARWREPGEWPRLSRSGFVIRADVFRALGGFEPEYGQFAPALLSARLHARGIRIGAVPGAAVVHLDSERVHGHHADTADYVRGELDARSRNDPVFFARYFGHAPAWANQVRHRRGVARSMARAVIAAARARPGRAAELARLLPPLAIDGVVGAAPRAALDRLAVSLDEVAVERLPLPARWRWARYLRAHARVVRQTQREWLARQGPLAAPLPAPERSTIDRLGPDAIAGVHALETHRGRLFRWTEPVVLVRVSRSEAHELRIETGGIRGDPLDALIAVVAGARVLPRELSTSDPEGNLVVRLPAPWPAAARDGLVLVCSALKPARGGARDGRLLGLPVLSIATAPLRGGACTPTPTG
jgi:hypothetical protein